MDLDAGAREFWDCEDDDDDSKERYNSMTFGQKVKYQLTNW
jgi:hypothetical protein